jgi:caa(3)-type oxidase subunit IV
MSETRRLWITWIALLLLAGLTFALSFAPLGAFSMPVTLAIAAAKGALVVLLFMELASTRVSPRLALVCSLLLLAILVALASADVLTRHAAALAPG